MDDIAHVKFGVTSTQGTRATTIAPAAPNAQNDTYNVFEDGVATLDIPSTVPAPIVLNVLASDTDADGNALTVTAIDIAPLHGIVTIAPNGKTVIYTPFEDYAGPDTFTYAISDGHGGQDSSVVNLTIAAVADVPTLTYEVQAGDAVNQIKIKVTATQADADSSEYIDRLPLDTLPDGVTASLSSINPGTEPDQLVYELILTLPLNADASFNLGVNAVMKEVSNGDEQTGNILIPIALEYNQTTVSQQFLAADQSMWDTGDEFSFVDDRFLGVDVSTGPYSDDLDFGVGGAYYNLEAASLKADFQSTLTFEGGEVHADLTYDLTVSTNYNKTTDTLLVSSSALLDGGSFHTTGPEGSYLMDLIFNCILKGQPGIDIAEIIDEDIEIDESGDHTENFIDLTSDELSVTFGHPVGADTLTVTLTWPDLEVDGTASNPPAGEFSGTGSSDNFLQLNLDVDQFFADFIPRGENPSTTALTWQRCPSAQSCWISISPEG